MSEKIMLSMNVGEIMGFLAFATFSNMLLGVNPYILLDIARKKFHRSLQVMEMINQCELELMNCGFSRAFFDLERCN